MRDNTTNKDKLDKLHTLPPRPETSRSKTASGELVKPGHTTYLLILFKRHKIALKRS